MHKLKIRRIGNSLGAILPADVLERLHVGEGEELFLVEEGDGVKLSPYDPEFEAVLRAFEDGQKKYRNALRKLAE
ncbi:MAG: AbrB/MazE/SpoVT family DNA-binding domain-containing protein [Candidatus Hydrogenedentes bacterium]|nr:AbrB/MazE/SpoVT family DNA-binding domain-containing protein [Candidatus Hydrogenedentota bacterium]MBI3118632.1 AbrB/MazE/SpoVT family DNA-binding domain-containing protein [Candidatus Hydrogenedentota bacterium]